MKLVMTGGHHSSALPVINLIKKRFPDWEIYWFGHRHSLKNDKNDTLEYKEITALNIPFFELQTGKVYKVYNPFKILKVFVGLSQAYHQLKTLKPDLIVSFGGYLAVPVVLAGYLLKIKSVTHEQTLVVGYANKLIAHFSEKILLSWDSSKQYFPSHKVVVTGLPLREEIFTANSDDYNAENSQPNILILGGKSGSHLLNLVIKEALPFLLKSYNVIHQCGDYSVFNDYDQLINAYRKIEDTVPGKYFCQKFILGNQIGEAYHRADLVISRSGAHTIAELVALNKKSLLVPIPWVSHNEQYVNASYVRDLGLAEILDEKDLETGTLLMAIDKLNKKVTVNVENSFKQLSLKAAENILNEILLTSQKTKTGN